MGQTLKDVEYSVCKLINSHISGKILPAVIVRLVQDS